MTLTFASGAFAEGSLYGFEVVPCRCSRLPGSLRTRLGFATGVAVRLDGMGWAEGGQGCSGEVAVDQ